MCWGEDRGSYRFEGDKHCIKWGKLGELGCGYMFRNPKGTSEERNEFIWVTEGAIYPFSLED